MPSKQDQTFSALWQHINNADNAAPWKMGPTPAQDALTNNALAANDWLQKGDYAQLPKGMFFNFQQPDEALEQYKKYANVNQGGTFALAQGNPGGRSTATALQGDYLRDRFARDASQNYQNNIANAASNVQNALGQSSAANLQTQSLGLQGQQVNNQFQENTMDVLGRLAGSYAGKQGIWGDVLKAGGMLGAAAITKF